VVGNKDVFLRRRLRREAQLAAALRHPNIVKIYNVEDIEGVLVIATEYVPGKTLEEILRTAVPLPIAETLKLLEQACAGLQCAHDQGVVHRRLDLRQIMVDEQGFVRIMDFDAPDAGDYPAAIIGSLDYMAPEQIDGRPIDGRTDIFSVGAIAYELLTGSRALPRNDLLRQGLTDALLKTQPIPLSQRRPELGIELERVVATAMSLDPNRRFAQIGDMGAALARIRISIECQNE
jgi:serine/threonine-protein kinase